MLTRSFAQIPLLTELRQEKHYFIGLHNADIISKLHQRSMKFAVNQDLPVLKELRACQVHGIQGVPALMFSCPNSTLEEFCTYNM